MENQNLKVQLKQPHALALHESKEKQAILDNYILASFSLQKTYGKDGGSLDLINPLFHNILGPYPAEKVIKAFETWMERSQEFPTPADIIGLIKRNGKPAPTKEMYVAVSKKDYENRTETEKQLMREYEAEYHNGSWGTMYPDPVKEGAVSEENTRLRLEVLELKAEIKKLTEVLWEERKKNGLSKAEPTHEDKIKKTIQHMIDTGVSPADIDEFIKTA